MLILIEATGEPLLSPDDVTPEAAKEMIDNGTAVLIDVIKTKTRVRFPDLGVSFAESSLLCVPRDIPERYAKAMLSPNNRGTVFYENLV